MSEYQSVTLAKSFLSRTKLSFEIMIKKGKTKRQTCPLTMVNNSYIQNWLADLHGSILSCPWSDDRSRLAIFRCSCVYFTTQYNVHYDNRLAGHLLSVLRLERCTAAIILPHNKMAQKSLNSVTVHLKLSTQLQIHTSTQLTTSTHLIFTDVSTNGNRN